MNNYNMLFSPFQIKSMILKNRIVMSPMGSNFAQSDGQMSPEHIEYYRLRAAGGVGLIILENVCVDFPKGANGTTQLRLDQDCFIPSLYTFNETMHRYGCCTSVQINHAGCTAIPARIGCTPVSASNISLADGSFTEELSVEEIYRLTKQYGRAAARAKNAGFDAVEIHAGHGYLLNQFLSATWNHRTDEFGGSVENRARFCRLVIDEVRKAVGENYPIMIRLSLEEFTETGNTLEESLAIMETLKDGVDIIDASVGIKYAMDVAQLPDGWRTYLARAVKERFGIPCAVMGNIRDPKMANELITQGETDLVVIGRGLIADPQWAMKAQAGRDVYIRPCISCNTGCVAHRLDLNQPIRCTVNPSIDREEWHKIHQVKKRCNVVVVGGGVSGLEAACTAAETGCTVTLLEKEAELGGWLRKIAKIPRKFRMQRLLDYMLHRADALKNLTCLTGVIATSELIRAFKPDLVVWSIGSEPFHPAIPGLQERLNAPNGRVTDVNGFLKNLDKEADITGKQILLAGGGPVALDIAEFFAENGNQVTIVEMLPEIGRGQDTFSKQYTLEVFAKHKVVTLLSHRVKEVRDDSVLVFCGGEQKEIPYDYAFCALGLRSKPVETDIWRVLETSGIPCVSIGDGKQARKMYHGIAEGRDIVEYLKAMDVY